MDERPPEDIDDMAFEAQRTAERHPERVVLQLVDGFKPPLEMDVRPASEPRPTQWGGFIAVDMRTPEALTRDVVRRMKGVVSAAIGVEHGAASRCEGTVITTVFDLADDSSASREMLSAVTDTVAEEFANGTVVRSDINFCDPDAVRLTPTAGGLAARVAIAAVRTNRAE